MPVKKKLTSKKKTTKRKASVKSTVSKQISLLKEQLESFKKQMRESSSAKLDDSIEDLSDQLNKMVSININLQSKMTELLIKVTDLIRENRELIGLLEEASAGEEEGEVEVKNPDYEGLLVEMKKIEKNTSDLLVENLKLNNYIKKNYTRRLLSSAIQGKVKEENNFPAPPEEEETGIPLPTEEVSISGL